jgi:hypothetical protein
MSAQPIPKAKFLLLKAPASTLYEEKFGGDACVFTVAMFVERMISKNNLIGLAVDCTTIDCDAFDPDTADPSKKVRYFHNGSEWDEFDVDYVRLKPNSNVKTKEKEISDGIPDDKTVLEFIHHCVTLWNSRPNAHIAVFDSRGGIGAGAYLVACFMVQKMKVPLHEALAGIKESMDPGLFDEGLLRILQEKFHGQQEIRVPKAPAWHVSGADDEADLDDDNDDTKEIIIPPYVGTSKKRPASDSRYERSQNQRKESIKGLEPCASGSPKYDRALSVLQQLSGSQLPSVFAGCEDCVMTADMLESELTQQYNVSWHPIGRRGLLLVLNDGVFFIEPPAKGSGSDKLNVSKANGVFFPRPADPTKPQHRTLIDGVLVEDKETSASGDSPTLVPRYLAMDIIAHEGGIVKSKPLPQRIKYLLDGVYGARKRCRTYNFNAKECFRFRVRDVFELRKTPFLLSTFLDQVTHPVDGIVFLPNNCAYSVDRTETGKRVLLWKKDGDIAQAALEARVNTLLT